MRRLITLIAFCTASAAYAETTYLGLYIKGHHIGYSSYAAGSSAFRGQGAEKNFSRTVMDAGLLGQALTVQMDSTTWSTKSGHPLRMVFDIESGGRGNKIDAIFGSNSVDVTIENGGVKTKRALSVPKSAEIVDDPLTLVLNGKLKVGSSRTLFVLDPTTVSFMKNVVSFIGAASTTVNGIQVKARLIRITDDRSVTDVYINSKGDLVRVDGAMGIYMLPVSRTVAMAKNKIGDTPLDLAESSSIKPDKDILDASELSHLKLRISSKSVSAMPSDEYQTATKSGADWLVDIHPPQLSSEPRTTVSTASRGKPEWTLPSLNMPCDQPVFRELVHKIVGSKQSVIDAAFAIQKYVFDNMRPNAGIGVLRDATEVLKTKEGVCRDYATLTVTLLRAAHIPARLASGLVTWDGTFYYHAWAEAWDGTRWIGIDSTTDRAQMSASHVKLGEGNVEAAFSFSFLEGAKISVLDARKD